MLDFSEYDCRRLALIVMNHFTDAIGVLAETVK